MMQHTKYQGSMPYSFIQGDFFMFFHILAYLKPVTPGVQPFLVPGACGNKLGRGQLGYATNQISRL